jgi:hypothetical protein
MLADLVKSGRERSIKLERPLPVYLVYFTAWAELDARYASTTTCTDVMNSCKRKAGLREEPRHRHRSVATEVRVSSVADNLERRDCPSYT